MLMPSIFREDLFDNWMDFSFPEIDKALYGKNAKHVMKTDVKETETGFEIDMDLPGFKKEDVKISLKDGNLSIQAAKGLDKDEKDEKGRYIRRERYAGSMSRSFFIGNQVTDTDIHAKFEDGILRLTFPKIDKKQVEENKYIAIEG